MSEICLRAAEKQLQPHLHMNSVVNTRVLPFAVRSWNYELSSYHILCYLVTLPFIKHLHIRYSVGALWNLVRLVIPRRSETQRC